MVICKRSTETYIMRDVDLLEERAVEVTVVVLDVVRQ